MDIVQTYGIAKDWEVGPRIVLVEGASDEELFRLTHRLAAREGIDLRPADICIVAAGPRDRGGTFGVGRELIALRSMSDRLLTPEGERAYHIIGLVDDDHAGRVLIEDVKKIDRGVLEFRDMLRLRPVMARLADRDYPRFERDTFLANARFRDIDWEIEDTVAAPLLETFIQARPNAVISRQERGGRTHIEFSTAGKRQLHAFLGDRASFADLAGVVAVLATLRSMFELPHLELPARRPS